MVAAHNRINILVVQDIYQKDLKPNILEESKFPLMLSIFQLKYLQLIFFF